MDSSKLPQWLGTLLKEKFFNPCVIHEASKRNEKNIFCLDCCQSICSHCSSLHTSHRLLQVRRYIYHDVVRLTDAEKLMDCAFVQSYRTNNAKVVFINRKVQRKALRGTNNNNSCINCYRALQHPFLYCSLSCKIENILSTGGRVSKYLHKCDHLTLLEPGPGPEEAQMTPESVLEPPGSQKSSSNSSSSVAGGIRDLVFCTATTEVVRKKRSTLTFRAVAMMMNRRKSNPTRSPLF